MKMRMSMIAAGIGALLAADGASAQRMVMAGPGTAHVDSRYVGTAGSRWGSRVDGHWWAGVNAPGGWRGYRRPYRGWVLPGYWLAADYGVGDWATYGLGAPPAGYGWTRYYDDAVLIDGNGRVYDSVSGVDWDRGDAYYTADAGASAVTYSQPVPYAAAPYAAAPYAAPVAPAYAPGASYAPPPAYVEQRNSGVGGALVGAAVGAGAGYAIGGRGNRVAGSLIGAGVGGAAGYAIDRSSYHRVPVAPSGGYAPPPPLPPAIAYAPPPPPAGGVWRSPDGGTVISTSSAGGVYGGSTTTITVQTAPVVTTTTTEIVEDRVTYTRHRVARHRWVHRAPTCGCR